MYGLHGLENLQVSLSCMLRYIHDWAWDHIGLSFCLFVVENLYMYFMLTLAAYSVNICLVFIALKSNLLLLLIMCLNMYALPVVQVHFVCLCMHETSYLLSSCIVL